MILSTLERWYPAQPVILHEYFKCPGMLGYPPLPQPPLQKYTRFMCRVSPLSSVWQRSPEPEEEEQEFPRPAPKRQSVGRGGSSSGAGSAAGSDSIKEDPESGSGSRSNSRRSSGFDDITPSQVSTARIIGGRGGGGGRLIY